MSDTANRLLAILQKVLAHEISGRYSAPQDLLDVAFDDLDIDSLAKLDVVMETEDAFDLQLDEKAVTDCRTARDLVALIEASLTKAGHG